MTHIPLDLTADVPFDGFLDHIRADLDGDVPLDIPFDIPFTASTEVAARNGRAQGPTAAWNTIEP